MAACSSGGNDPAPTTTALYAPCVAVGEVTPTLDALNTACLDGGQVVAAATADQACADGRTLVWNDRGWGYVGEPWQAHGDGPQIAPEADRNAC